MLAVPREVNTPRLDGQREVVLGPDLSDRRNVMLSLIKSQNVQDAIRKEICSRS